MGINRFFSLRQLMINMIMMVHKAIPTKTPAIITKNRASMLSGKAGEGHWPKEVPRVSSSPDDFPEI